MLGVVLLAGDPFFEVSSSSKIIDNCLSFNDLFNTGLLSRCSEVLIRADLLGSSLSLDSGDTLLLGATFGGRPTLRPGEGFLAGETFLAGDAFLAGEALRAGDTFLAGDVRFALAGEALRAGDAFLAGGEGVLLRPVDFRPRLAVSAGPGTTDAAVVVAAPGAPLVARRLSIPPGRETKKTRSAEMDQK